MSEVTVWNHTRKGTIRGKIVEESGEFVDIELAGDQTLKYSNGNDYKEAGEVITVRKSFLTEVQP